MMKYIVSLLLLAACAASARADDFTPYLEGSEHKISEQEYSDLRSYVERAQKTLMRTLDDAPAFSGVDLRAHVLGGIQQALASSDLRGELLLFRYVLSRAIETDTVFYADGDGDERAQLVAQVVLIPAIESALKYYQTSDLPRLASNVVPSPNWLEFAADQVPHLLRAVDLAPTKDKATELAWQALGWTARSLNSSLERRSSEVADFIVRLGELYNTPNRRHPSFISRAQESLLAVYKKYRAPLPVISLAPASAGLDLKMRDATLARRLGGGFGSVGHGFGAAARGIGSGIKKIFTLPILGIGPKDDEILGKDWTEGDSENGELKHHVGGIKLARVSVLGGAGMGSTYDSAATDTKSSGVALLADARFVAVDYSCENDCGPAGSFFAEASSHVIPGSAGKDWGYSMNLSANATVFGLLGIMGAIEKNDYSAFEETLTRIGFAPHLIIRIGKQEYVLVQGFVGPMRSADDEFEYTEVGAKVVVQKKRFSVLVGATMAGDTARDPSDARRNLSRSRTSVESTVNLPLGLFVRNDGLIFKGQAIKYEDRDGDTDEKIGSRSAAAGLVFYGLSW